MDIDYVGNDLNAGKDDKTYARGSGMRNSAAECQQLCQERVDCKFFTYKTTDRYCYLKASNTVRNRYRNAISGKKYCDDFDKFKGNALTSY